VKIEIEEAYNGWIVKSSEHSSREAIIFEHKAGNKWRTSVETICESAQGVLNFILQQMLNSDRYTIVIKSPDTEKEDVGS
jgi:hypothetical protein